MGGELQITSFRLDKRREKDNPIQIRPIASFRPDDLTCHVAVAITGGGGSQALGGVGVSLDRAKEQRDTGL